ncbi:MurR/RpiR family transcriptional regulator [Vagococcus acidifermentans]|uniref:HTH rpiR-type domain-containing protein n=1 Tax=Vagococcus acidifermentans TaxID=564710 RepID=A0A430AVT4_9ENTE|nr:MurR/RpiR family transcriptional regulator [Vagococcus acidifermentans]RSU12170.1 hypothetical protein CBF27_07030 [Vagococcus acidifermentans]
MGSRSLSTTEKYTLTYLVQHRDQVVNLTIEKLAENAHVSPATIIRALKKKGYSGYSEYKNLVKHQSVKQHSHFSDEINEVINKNLEEVTKTIEYLSADTIEEAVKAIHKSQRLFIFATGTSISVANYLTRKFQLSDKYWYGNPFFDKIYKVSFLLSCYPIALDSEPPRL